MHVKLVILLGQSWTDVTEEDDIVSKDIERTE